jgi:hypothetical protein
MGGADWGTCFVMIGRCFEHFGLINLTTLYTPRNPHPALADDDRPLLSIPIIDLFIFITNQLVYQSLIVF